MAVLDKKFELMDATSIVGNNAATVGGDNILDLGTATDAWGQSITPDIGEGGQLFLNVKIATKLTTNTTFAAPYVTFKLYTSTGTVVDQGTLLFQKAITSDLSVGYDVFRGPIPAGKIQRYLGCAVLIGAASVSAGALDAWISLDSETFYPVT